MWELPFYHEPDAFFSGQKLGELYIHEAPHVPERASSPFNTMVMDRLMTVLISLKTYANQNQLFDAVALEPEARRLLAAAQADLETRVGRNVLYRPQTEPSP